MHFVTGGAFNGKSDWVKAYIQGNEINCHWISSYRQDECPARLEYLGENVVVLEGIEQWIKGLLTGLNAGEVRKKWRGLLETWLMWERSHQGRSVILIGSDVTKGIVPTEAEDRLWRDVTGWTFQDTTTVCERVDLIWYGINNRLK